MEGEVTYTEVKLVPKGKHRRPSTEQHTQCATVRVPQKSGSRNPPSTSPSGPGSRHPCRWVATVLGIASLSLLLIIVYLSAHKNCENSQGSQKGNTSFSNISCVDGPGNKNSTWIAALKEELCPGQQDAICELCPQGWKLNGSRCYYFSEELQNWTVGAQDCANKKSWLLVLEDEAEADRVRAMRPRDEHFWIGYKYNTTRGQWMWLDDSGFSGYRIEINYPTGKNCVSSKGKSSITPEDCDTSHRAWICKRNVTVLEP
ncbi:natural killer cells antigen CD94-like isoform X2 [Ornithorhynchus anatinus]|uniref:C-type lectin domain-containing protein n=1 Tax=Ornithorhynchus anatinus TaxID=9258 RepID=A0A6I8P244_ORNAN|nr:natural killer cells antigen CD94-like isoform X2 [Ornithorhynchus anatinus]